MTDKSLMEEVRIDELKNVNDSMCLTSIAISLKRIADAMTGPCNEYGETMTEAIYGAITRGIRDAK